MRFLVKNVGISMGIECKRNRYVSTDRIKGTAKFQNCLAAPELQLVN